MTEQEFCREASASLLIKMGEIMLQLPSFYDECKALQISPRQLFEALEVRPPEALAKKEKALTARDHRTLLPDDRRVLFDRLCRLRLELAKKENLPAYIIFSNRALSEMCLRLPANREELCLLPYVGEKKAAKYGDAFLALIREAKDAAASAQK